MSSGIPHTRGLSLEERLVFYTPPVTDYNGTAVPRRLSKSVWPSGRKQACHACRQRKKRCDGKTPTCGLCARAGNLCIYTAPPSTGGPQANDPWRAPLLGSNASCNVDANPRSASIHQAVGPPTPSTASRHTSDSQSDDDLNRVMFEDSQTLPRDGPANANGGLAPSRGPCNSRDDTLWGLKSFPMSFTELNMDLHDFSEPLVLASSQHGFASAFQSSPNGAPPLSSAADSTISQDQFRAFFTVFLERCHSVLPCLSQARLRTRMDQEYQDFMESPLFWTIAGIAAWYQRETDDSTQNERWLQKAVILIDANIKAVKQPLETLQALVYIAFQSYTSASMVDMWVQLGMACRHVGLLGWNLLDARWQLSPTPYAPRAATEEEQEERRKVVWTLFLLDRAMSCMTGWPLGIQDRQFMVRYPMPEPAFQRPGISAAPECYSMDLSELLSPESFRRGLKSDTMGFVMRGYVLLGRIIAYHNDVHQECDPGSLEFCELEDALTRFHLLISRASSQPSEDTSRDYGKEIWLRILIETCTILHYHPTVDRLQRESSYDDREVTPGFKRCVAAARKIVKLIKDEAFHSIEALMSPLLLPSYFLACRFLTITWYESKNAQDRRSIDTILMLVDRMADVCGPLADKYKRCINHDISRDPKDVHRLRRGTGNYISETCNT